MKIHLPFATILAAATVVPQPASSLLEYSSSTAGDNRFADLKLVHRLFVPYGPDQTTTPPQDPTEVWDGYGFGMGAVEHVAYDPVQGYVYAQSEGFPGVSVIDYSVMPPKMTPFSLDFTQYDSEIKDVAVCPQEGLLFVVATDYDHVLMYHTVQRNDPKMPTLIEEIDAGARPDNIRIRESDCLLAVANENDGDALAQGAVHLVSGLRQNGSPTVRKVSLGAFDDDYLLNRDVHMPLTANAMEYWDEVSDLRDEIDWSNVRANYNPAIFMQPEFMRFSGTNELLLNLQKNSAVVRINVDTALAVSVDGYGLKAWDMAGDGIDIIKDDGCDFYAQSDILFTTLAPDGFDVVNIDGQVYMLTANEGSDADYGPYEEKIDAGDLFSGLVLGPTAFTASSTFFSTTNSSQGDSAPFNSDCENHGTQLPFCADNFEISLGSSAVDYSDPQAPIVQKVVGFGGRGISVFKVPTEMDGRLELVWDSGSDFEIQGCDSFPWAHNGVQDEDFAPVDGTRYELFPDERDGLDDMNDKDQDGCEDAGDGNPGACPISGTIDEKAPEDGLAPESVVVALACDRVLALSCGENNGSCLLYDITDITKGEDPVLEKVFNLSPASETKSPGVAYKDRTLGDLDAEVTFFVPAKESPTGKAGIMFGGAHSGTLSFWEFECQDPVDPVDPSDRAFVGIAAEDEGDDDDGPSSQAIVGIVVGVIAGVALIGFIAYTTSKQQKKLPEDTKELEMTQAQAGNGDDGMAFG